MGNKSNGDNMNVISETQSGVWSFKGIGFVYVDGFKIAVCGSKKINLGNGAKVRYCEKQIKRVNEEEEFDAVASVEFATSTGAGDPVVNNAIAARPILYDGVVDGVDLGASFAGPAAPKCTVSEPFKITGVRTADGATEYLSKIDDALHEAPDGPNQIWYLSIPKK